MKVTVPFGVLLLCYVQLSAMSEPHPALYFATWFLTGVFIREVQLEFFGP